MSVTTCAQELIRSPGTELPPEFWQLVEHYRAELVNQALAITGDLHDAEDVVQETFCEAFRDRARVKQLRSIGAWLRTINRDNALDRIRSRKRDSKRIDQKQQQAQDRCFTTGGFSLIEMRDLVAKAIEKLAPRTRTAVVLCYWDHLNPDQIAERMQLSPRTVRRLLFEASSHLYESLEPHGLQSEPPPQDAEAGLCAQAAAPSGGTQ